MKPFVKRAKNDRNDAEAICEAAARPGMRFVLAKSAEQQAQGMVLKVRETLVSQRTRLINADSVTDCFVAHAHRIAAERVAAPRAAMLMGYARTSTAGQNAGLAAQERDLKGAGCTKLFSEQVRSVANRAFRTTLASQLLGALVHE